MLVVSALRDLRKRLVPPYQGRARLRQGIVWFALLVALGRASRVVVAEIGCLGGSLAHT